MLFDFLPAEDLTPGFLCVSTFVREAPNELLLRFGPVEPDFRDRSRLDSVD